MGRHSTAAKLLAWLLAGTMMGFGAQAAGACTAMVFKAKDGTGMPEPWIGAPPISNPS